jgi:DNA polymerase-3 subunit epsilon
MDEFELCPRLCNLAKGADCAAGHFAEGCSGQCCSPAGPGAYNSRVQDAMLWIARSLPTMVLIDTGRHEDEQSCILIENGIFKGMGYFSAHTDIYDLALFQGCIEPMPDNDYIRNLVFRHATDYPQKCIRWEDGLMHRHGAAGISLIADAYDGVDVIYAD